MSADGFAQRRRSRRRWLIGSAVILVTLGLLVACFRTSLGPYEWEAVGTWRGESATLDLRADGTFSASGLDSDDWAATEGDWKIDNFAGPDSSDFAVVLFPPGERDSLGVTTRSLVVTGGIWNMRLRQAEWDAEPISGLVLER
jgi:hypothetical protein